MEWFAGKILDIFSRFIWHILVRFFKFASPLKITPKKISSGLPKKFLPIISLQIKNKTNKSLYNVRIVGVSRNKFDITVISDNLEKVRTVEHMSLNTNILVAYVKEIATKNYGWILMLHKIEGSSTVNLRIKSNNDKDVFLKIMDYSFKETPICERSDGVVKIPFTDKPLPRIK